MIFSGLMNEIFEQTENQLEIGKHSETESEISEKLNTQVKQFII